MFSFMNMFKKEPEIYLQTTYDFDVRVPPSQLIKVLNPHLRKNKKQSFSISLNNDASGKSNQQLKNFIKKISKTTKNGAKIMRILVILHLLIIYSDQFYSVVDSVLPLNHQCTDSWLVNTVIKPYEQFIQKCCSSRQYYCKNKELTSISYENSFERLFYLINMLNQLFKCVKKMSLLGRYYKEEHDVNTSLFVNMVALQAQKFYSNFKNVLTDMLLYSNKYIKTSSDQQIMKGILNQSLLMINQEMKKLFLDKYFYPYGKGIGVRLFRAEQQSEECAKTIQSILNDHQQTNRRRDKIELQQKIFPQEGVFNANFFEKSLMETFIHHKGNVPGGEQQIAEQDIEQGFDVQEARKFTQIAQKEQDIQKGQTYNLKKWQIQLNNQKDLKNKKQEKGLLNKNSTKLKQLKSTDCCQKKSVDIHQF